MAEWAVEEDMKGKGQRRTENSRHRDAGKGRRALRGQEGGNEKTVKEDARGERRRT